MINLNKESIKKLKDIDTKADAIIINAEKKAESIISQARQEVPDMVNSSKDTRDKKKSLEIEAVRKTLEEKNKQMIEEGTEKVLSKAEVKKEKINLAAEIAAELFIKKIEIKNKV